MKFSEAQLEQYRTYGYVIVDCPFPERLTEECMAAVEKAAQDPAEGPADGGKRNHFHLRPQLEDSYWCAPRSLPAVHADHPAPRNHRGSPVNWLGTAISTCAMAASMSRPPTDRWGGISTGVRGGRSSCTTSPGLRARTGVCALFQAATPDRPLLLRRRPPGSGRNGELPVRRPRTDGKMSHSTTRFP